MPVKVSAAVDKELIDALKDAFGYKTDVEVAGFLGVEKQTIYAARHGISPLGEIQRLKILDRILYRKTENLALRCLPTNLANRIREIRRNQHDHWALKEIEPGPPSSEDAELLNLYKDFKGLRTDREVAEALGLKRQSISMVRTGRNKLGPLPRLRIFRDVWGERIDHVEAAIESSDVLLAMVKEYISEKS